MRRSEPDPLHLVLGEPLFGAVIKLGRARAFVRGHFLGVLERAAVREVSGNPGRAERVAANFRHDVEKTRSPLDVEPG